LLASFGKIHAPLFRQLLPVVNPSLYNTNVSVQIALDYGGCIPALQNWKGKVAWYASLACDASVYGQGYPYVTQWRAFQDAGASGIIVSSFTGGDVITSQLFTAGEPYNPSIPVVGFYQQQSWTQPFSATNNPIGPIIFAFPSSTNITAFFDTPEVNEFYRQLYYPPSVWGFVIYSSIALNIVAMLYTSCKLSLFISSQGIKFNLPQLVLAGCAFSSLLCWMWVLWGPSFAQGTWGGGYTTAVATFFTTTYVPFWLCGITLYSFYLVEVSSLTSSEFLVLLCCRFLHFQHQRAGCRNSLFLLLSLLQPSL
jgi:hypothetical protein